MLLEAKKLHRPYYGAKKLRRLYYEAKKLCTLYYGAKKLSRAYYGARIYFRRGKCVDKSARSNIRVKLWYNERVGEGAVYIPHRAAG